MVTKKIDKNKIRKTVRQEKGPIWTKEEIVPRAIKCDYIPQHSTSKVKERFS